MSRRCPSARTASLAVFHDTASPSATRAIDRCWRTIPTRPQRSPAREILARGCAAAVVSWRHTCAALGAPVAAHRDQQRRGAPPERLVRQPPGHGAARDALAAAPPAPVIRLHDPAGQHGPVGLEPLPGHHQAEVVQTGEGRQVRAREGSVSHVEVFRMGSVRTPIIGRPRPSPRHRRASPLYTLICEEPHNQGWRGVTVSQLTALLADSRRTVVNDDDGLYRAVLASLDRFAARMHGIGQAFWNETRPSQEATDRGKVWSPKYEADISAMIRDHLVQDFGEELVVNREVQVKQTSSTGSGLMVDVLPTATQTASQRLPSCPIEVKGPGTPP